MLRTYNSLTSLLRILVIPDEETSADAKVDHRMSLRHRCHESLIRLSHLDGLQNLIRDLKLIFGQESEWLVCSLIDTYCIEVVRLLSVLCQHHLSLNLLTDSFVCIF